MICIITTPQPPAMKGTIICKFKIWNNSKLFPKKLFILKRRELTISEFWTIETEEGWIKKERGMKLKRKKRRSKKLQRKNRSRKVKKK